MAACARAGDGRRAHVGGLMWDYFMVACHLDPRVHLRLWQDGGGALAAYAILGEDPSFQCQAAPDWEGAGLEAEALAWAEGRLADLRRSEPGRWGGPLFSGAWRDDERRSRFLEENGFVRREEFDEFVLKRSLADGIPKSRIPEGYRIRAVADSGEASLRADVQREVWSPWPVGRIGGEDYARLMRMDGYDRELDVIAVAPDGTIAAYANGWIDPVNRIGNFGPVGARPAHRRRGLTRAVLWEGMRRMQARGMNRVCISTGISNVPARNLYESIGFREANRVLGYAKPDRGGGSSTPGGGDGGESDRPPETRSRADAERGK
ncbi:MAG: GNAT family N-acetyltransferase [Anaerolineales bacterium]|nr:GNAT family N-acetyltransferase [Anaerolineales bacterium]